MPPLSATETETTKVLSQYSSVMVCVNTIILPILAMVWCLRTCKFAERHSAAGLKPERAFFECQVSS